jgi:NAD(P)-dependent dehydrogenase (short-subunit alcohol dehydrogenase family)
MSASEAPRRIVVTGSADGLGLELARQLAAAGHLVVVHGRDEHRAEQARDAVPGALDAVAGDLASVAQTRALAEQISRLGPFHAVVHNAAVGFRDARLLTGDGIEHVFAINVLAPYVLTCLVPAPPRLIYLSSGLHRQGDPEPADLSWERRAWNGMQAYSDSKLYDVMLAFAVARLWPQTLSNAVEPGWIATKMGGAGAPGDLAQGVATQLWLVTSDDPAATVRGELFHDRRRQPAHGAAGDIERQERLLDVCEQISGVHFPGRDEKVVGSEVL